MKNQLRTKFIPIKKMVSGYHGNNCVACGKSGELFPLSVAHIGIPVAADSESSKNLTLLCQDCYAVFNHSPTETEFVSFLTALMQRSQLFRDVRQDVQIGHASRYRVDILSKRIESGKTETLIVECRIFRGIIRQGLGVAMAQLKSYAGMQPQAKVAFAIPATIRSDDRKLLEDNGIEVWDLEFISRTFADQMPHDGISYFQILLAIWKSRSPELSREQKLLQELRHCKPGKRDWFVYQKVIGDILERLFIPALSPPRYQVADAAHANIRDFIFPNYSSSGFWSFLRLKYEADYIVIDAKNYTSAVEKSDVLQIANYLKSYGAGLFGIIVSRFGSDNTSCEHTLRELWQNHRKLILILDDNDIEAMLIAKQDGNQPEDVIGLQIEEFRLSM